MHGQTLNPKTLNPKHWYTFTDQKRTFACVHSWVKARPLEHRRHVLACVHARPNDRSLKPWGHAGACGQTAFGPAYGNPCMPTHTKAMQTHAIPRMSTRENRTQAHANRICPPMQTCAHTRPPDVASTAQSRPAIHLGRSPPARSAPASAAPRYRRYGRWRATWLIVDAETLLGHRPLRPPPAPTRAERPPQLPLRWHHRRRREQATPTSTPCGRSRRRRRCSYRSGETRWRSLRGRGNVRFDCGRATDSALGQRCWQRGPPSPMRRTPLPRRRRSRGARRRNPAAPHRHHGRSHRNRGAAASAAGRASGLRARA
eukprot:338369-Chlamydomonas_euryale.AAC.6